MNISESTINSIIGFPSHKVVLIGRNPCGFDITCDVMIYTQFPDIN
jgi:hypothetical protein